MDFKDLTLKERFAACRGQPKDLERRNQWLLKGATAAGRGSAQERLLRLMSWTAGVLPSKAKHTKITHPLAILESGEGWCDQACKVWGFMAHHVVGVPARLYALRHSNTVEGHTVAEAYVDGRWALFDVHNDHQAVYRKPDGSLMGLDDLRADPDALDREEHWWKSDGTVSKRGFYEPRSRAMLYLPTQGDKLAESWAVYNDPGCKRYPPVYFEQYAGERHG